jgi:hypothetical protein
MPDTFSPTPYPDVNALIRELFESMHPILGMNLLAMYLDGSLASGAFDADSDVDFIVVTGVDVAGELFEALQAMHDRINQMDNPWAIQLEGFYISKPGIRRYDPAHALHANIERGQGERLKMLRLDQTWDVHRYILRKQGITLAGPAPEVFIDQVSPAQLQQAMLVNLSGWATNILNDGEGLKFRGYQSYVVLSLCRILYTLHNADIVSKAAAAHWAKANLDPRWEALIDSAWDGRHNSNRDASPEDVEGTQNFIRYALDSGNHFFTFNKPQVY